MKRIHLFEFHELEGFPQAWRRMLTDILTHFAWHSDPFYPVVPKLGQVLQRLQCREVIDFCSGSSGPILLVRKTLEEEANYPVHVTLTDKYPAPESFARAFVLSGGNISFVTTPVDATDVPAHLKGFRTFFTAFHHFQPCEAKKILQDAVAKKEGIGLFEYTERSLSWVIPVLLTPLRVWCITPLLRPLTVARLLWTYIMPVVPLVTMWDAMVSNLRTYSAQELQALTEQIPCDDYSWEIGKIGPANCKITYLLGFPHTRSGAA